MKRAMALCASEYLMISLGRIAILDNWVLSLAGRELRMEMLP